ncbi:MAG: UDP-N-acetylmuramoyl-L-alanine--D-glutamate ligase [Alphaproteobacteria bacterium]|nr:UDP-N-acetylmuramoyl-L-alanine--D-glutamate ligase [Alphaproteobacteria bacterium]
MIELPKLEGETAIFGLGRSGIAAAQALLASGNDVVAWDDTPLRDHNDIPSRDLTKDFGTPARLLLAPGVPPSHPIAQAAHKAGVKIIGDMDLFQLARNQMDNVCVIGITGTNGKSTTTALVHHILSENGWAVQMGGNIGTAVLSLDMPSDKKTAYVLELSSYQLELAQDFYADIGVWLNLTPDHLARHNTMENYAAAKAKLFASPEKMQAVIIGCDDDYGTAIANTLNTHPQLIRFFTSTADIEGASYELGFDGTHLLHNNKAVMDMTQTYALRGVHNAQNAAAAYGVGLVLGLSPDSMAVALTDFAGLAHRMQPVAQYKGIDFVNDSKATNSEATRCALAALHNIYWIAGGRAKDKTPEASLAGLDTYYGNITHAYLIGEAATGFATTLAPYMPCTIAASLNEAVDKAAQDAQDETQPPKQATILLSPACASFDQFTDFEARGDAFIAAVHAWIAQQEVGA